MTELEFWRGVCAGAIDGTEWMHVIWSWAGFKGLFPCTEAGLKQAIERLALAEASRNALRGVM
jgi:hypothetical protein